MSNEDRFKYKWCDKLLKARIHKACISIKTKTLDNIMELIRKENDYHDTINSIWEEAKM